jgi:Pilus assembly protein, PilO
VRRKPSQKLLAGVIAGALALGALASYFLLISPQNSKAAELGKEAESVRAELTQRRAAALEARQTEPIRVADLFRLTKAIPDEVDMPGVILELNRIARETGIRFDSITPQAPADSTSGYQVVPINLVFQGNYFELSDFMFRVRSLVGVRGGRLDATGRLFVVDAVAFSEGVKKFPQIQATLTVSAFVYGAAATAGAPPVAPPAPPVAPAPAPPASPDTPPVAPSSGATAAGATP